MQAFFTKSANPYLTPQRGMATLLIVLIILVILGVVMFSATQLAITYRSTTNEYKLRKQLLALAEGGLAIYEARLVSTDKSKLVCADEDKSKSCKYVDDYVTEKKEVEYGNGVTLHQLGNIEIMPPSHNTYKITATAYSTDPQLAVTVSKEMQDDPTKIITVLGSWTDDNEHLSP